MVKNQFSKWIQNVKISSFHTNTHEGKPSEIPLLTREHFCKRLQKKKHGSKRGLACELFQAENFQWKMLENATTLTSSSDKSSLQTLLANTRTLWLDPPTIRRKSLNRSSFGFRSLLFLNATSQLRKESHFLLEHELKERTFLPVHQNVAK